MKKRILSLILALSMVLSVFPLGAFAEGSTQDLVMGANGYPVYPDGTTGNGWEYKGSTLILKSGSYDFNYFYPKTNGGGVTEQTVHCEIKLEQNATITGGDFGANVTNDKGTISGGFFASGSGVTNSGTITGNGTFAGTVTNITGGTLPGGTISGGTFYGSVTNLNTIEKGTFEGNVTNSGTISGGTFAANKKVENYSYIENGTFEGSVTNYSYIEKGTFNGTVTNTSTGKISDGTFNEEVRNAGKIFDGTFNGKVSSSGTIANGTFSATVENNTNGTISGGTFAGSVTNDEYGMIRGGTFAGSVNNSNYGNIHGGVFNGKTGLDSVPGVHSITWDAASPDAKIVEVNGVPAEWEPYVVVTQWTASTAKEVTIKANTEIFSLNGRLLGEGDRVNGDKKTVKFTMPNENVVLGTGDLVMAGGYPVGSNNGNADCEGKGWTYSKIDESSNPKGKLTLTSGTFDFSSTYPQNTSKGAGAEPVACAVETQLRVEITGGTFEGEVINNDLGEISGGTFHEKVSNYNGMIIGGTFKSSVTSTGNGRIFGGVFNSKTTPKPENDAYTITLNTANAKITEVNGVPAEWEPYVVVTE